MMDRKQPPPFSSDFTFTLLTPEKSIVSNGADVYWIRDVQQDVVKIEIIFKGGKWYEPRNGVSFFTASLIDKGTKNRNSKDIADFLDQLGAQLECSSGLDYLSISLYSLNRTLDKALSLLSELLTESIFPPSELELAKNIQIQNLRINNEKNNFVASKLIRKNIFGAEHPYGKSLEESTINEITQFDLVNFYNSISPFQVYITGNITDQVHKEVIKCIERIPKRDLAYSPAQLNPLSSDERISKAESVQSSIRLGKIFIKNSDSGYADALVLNHLLGGYFGSRLMKNIREDKGLTYGIYSSINTFYHHGFFSIGAEVNKENIDLTISEILNEINKLRSIHISPEELMIVKNHLLGSLQLELANPFSVTEKIKNIKLNSLPSNFYTGLSDRILRISSSDILEIANRHFSPNDLYKVTVG